MDTSEQMRRPAGRRWLGLLVIGALVAGCDDAPVAPVPTPDAHQPPPPDQQLPRPDQAPRPDLTVDGAGPPPDPCQGYQPVKASYTVEIPHEGRTRTAHVRLPDGYDATQPVGVVLNFHGLSSNATQQALYSELPAHTRTRSLVAVHPEGVGTLGTQSWNAGLCCGFAASSGVDDVGFVALLLDRLEQEICIDPRRVFAMGMSNGGFFSYRLACELSDRIAAVGPVAGLDGMLSCNPARPVPVYHFHGTKDTIVPYDGNSLASWMSVPENMKAWAKRNGCGATPTEIFRSSEVVCEAWPGCEGAGDVQLCTIVGGGHTWPGGANIPIPWLGHMTTEISATQRLLDFFANHPLPASPTP